MTYTSIGNYHLHHYIKSNKFIYCYMCLLGRIQSLSKKIIGPVFLNVVLDGI